MREERVNAGLILRIAEHVLSLAVFVGNFVKRLYLHDAISGAGIFCRHFYAQQNVVSDVNERQNCGNDDEYSLHFVFDTISLLASNLKMISGTFTVALGHGRILRTGPALQPARRET